MLLLGVWIISFKDQGCQISRSRRKYDRRQSAILEALWCGYWWQNTRVALESASSHPSRKFNARNVHSSAWLLYDHPAVKQDTIKIEAFIFLRHMVSFRRVAGMYTYQRQLRLGAVHGDVVSVFIAIAEWRHNKCRESDWRSEDSIGWNRGRRKDIAHFNELGILHLIILPILIESTERNNCNGRLMDDTAYWSQ